MNMTRFFLYTYTHPPFPEWWCKIKLQLYIYTHLYINILFILCGPRSVCRKGVLVGDPSSAPWTPCRLLNSNPQAAGDVPTYQLSPVAVFKLELIRSLIIRYAGKVPEDGLLVLNTILLIYNARRKCVEQRAPSDFIRRCEVMKKQKSYPFLQHY